MTFKQSRLEHAACALVQYDGSDEEVLTDLLVDLRHWCDAHELDFAKADRVAYLDYLAEKT